MSTPIGFEHARGAAARFLFDPIRIFSETQVRDSTGGTTVTHQEVIFNPPLKAWIAAPSARRAAGGMADREASEIASQVENTSVVNMTLPYGTPVKEGDHVRAVGRLWKVTADLNLESVKAVSTRVLMREINEDGSFVDGP